MYFCPLNCNNNHFSLPEINERKRKIYHFDLMANKDVIDDMDLLSSQPCGSNWPVQSLSGIFDISVLLRIGMSADTDCCTGVGPADGADDVPSPLSILFRRLSVLDGIFVSFTCRSVDCAPPDALLLGLETLDEWMGRRSVLFRPRAGLFSLGLDIRLLLRGRMVGSMVSFSAACDASIGLRIVRAVGGFLL